MVLKDSSFQRVAAVATLGPGLDSPLSGKVEGALILHVRVTSSVFAHPFGKKGKFSHRQTTARKKSEGKSRRRKCGQKPDEKVGNRQGKRVTTTIDVLK